MAEEQQQPQQEPQQPQTAPPPPSVTEQPVMELGLLSAAREALDSAQEDRERLFQERFRDDSEPYRILQVPKTHLGRPTGPYEFDQGLVRIPARQGETDEQAIERWKERTEQETKAANRAFLSNFYHSSTFDIARYEGSRELLNNPLLQDPISSVLRLGQPQVPDYILTNDAMKELEEAYPNIKTPAIAGTIAGFFTPGPGMAFGMFKGVGNLGGRFLSRLGLKMLTKGGMAVEEAETVFRGAVVGGKVVAKEGRGMLNYLSQLFGRDFFRKVRPETVERTMEAFRAAGGYIDDAGQAVLTKNPLSERTVNYLGQQVTREQAFKITLNQLRQELGSTATMRILREVGESGSLAFAGGALGQAYEVPAYIFGTPEEKAASGFLDPETMLIQSAFPVGMRWGFGALGAVGRAIRSRAGGAPEEPFEAFVGRSALIDLTADRTPTGPQRRPLALLRGDLGGPPASKSFQLLSGTVRAAQNPADSQRIFDDAQGIIRYADTAPEAADAMARSRVAAAVTQMEGPITQIAGFSPSLFYSDPEKFMGPLMQAQGSHGEDPAHMALQVERMANALGYAAGVAREAARNNIDITQTLAAVPPSPTPSPEIIIARTAVLAKAVRDVAPEAPVGLPKDMGQELGASQDPAVHTGGPPVKIPEPAEAQELPSVQDFWTDPEGSLPSQALYDLDPAQALDRQQLATASLASFRPFVAGYLVADKPGTLADHEPRVRMVWADNEGRLLAEDIDPDDWSGVVYRDVTETVTGLRPVPRDNGGWRFKADRSAPVAFRLDPDRGALLLDKEATLGRTAQQRIWKKDATPVLGPDIDGDPTQLLETAIVNPPTKPSQAAALLQSIDRELAKHKSKGPTRRQAQMEYGPRLPEEGESEYEVALARRHREMQQEYDALGSVLEAARFITRNRQAQLATLMSELGPELQRSGLLDEDELAELARGTLTAHASSSEEVVRFGGEFLGIERELARRPQGLYLAIPPRGIASPHRDLGPEVFRGTVNPTANILEVEDTGFRVQHSRLWGGEGEVDASVNAIRVLEGPEEAQRIVSMARKELENLISERFGITPKGFDYDTLELATVYGSQLAKAAGYDGIRMRDRRPIALADDFSELVVLTPKAVAPSPLTAYASSPEDLEAMRLRAEALAHKASGEGWSRKAPLFGALTPDEKYEAVLARTQAYFNSQRHADSLNPHSWTPKRKPRYFGKWFPTSEQHEALKKSFDLHYEAWQNAQRQIEKATRAAAAKTRAKFDLRDLARMPPEALQRVAERDPAAWHEMVRAALPSIDGEIPEGLDLETIEHINSMAREAYLTPDADAIGSLPRPSAPPTLRHRASDFAALADEAIRGIRALWRQVESPFQMLGFKKQAAGPLERAQQRDIIQNSPFYKTHQGDLAAHQNIKRVLGRFMPLYNATFDSSPTQWGPKGAVLDDLITRALDIKAENIEALAIQRFGTTTPKFGGVKLDLTKEIPALRQEFARAIDELEEQYLHGIKLDLGNAKGDGAHCLGEIERRVLEAYNATATSPAVNTSHIPPNDFENIVEGLRKANKKAATAPPAPAFLGKPGLKRPVWLNDVRFRTLERLAARNFNAIDRLQREITATQAGERRIQEGYVPTMRRMVGDDIRDGMIDPYSIYSRGTRPEIRNDFLRHRNESTRPLSWAETWPIYVHAWSKKAHLEPALREGAIQMRKMSVPQQTYWRAWVASLKGVQPPSIQIANRMMLEQKPTLIGDISQALTGQPIPRTDSRGRQAGMERLVNNMAMATYFGFLSPARVAALSTTEFAWSLSELSKNPQDLYRAFFPTFSQGGGMWMPRGVALAARDGSKEIASWLRNKFNPTTPRWYSDPTLRGVTDFLMDVDDDLQRFGGGPRSLAGRTLLGTWSAGMRGTEFMLRATNYYTFYQQQKAYLPPRAPTQFKTTNLGETWQADDEYAKEMAAIITNGQIAQYGARDQSPFTRGMFGRSFFPLKRFGLQHLQNTILSLDASTEYAKHLASRTGSQRLLDWKLPDKPTEVGHIVPKPPQTHTDGGRFTFNPEEEDLYYRTNGPQAQYGSMHPPTASSARRWLLRLLGLAGLSTPAVAFLMSQVLDPKRENIWRNAIPFLLGTEMTLLSWFKPVLDIAGHEIVRTARGEQRYDEYQAESRALRELIFSIPILGPNVFEPSYYDALEDQETRRRLGMAWPRQQRFWDILDPRDVQRTVAMAQRSGQIRDYEDRASLPVRGGMSETLRNLPESLIRFLALAAADTRDMSVDQAEKVIRGLLGESD